MKTNYYNMTGSKILESLEIHCNEKIQCSARLRMQITSTLDRLVKDHTSLVSRVECVLKGFEVYDPSVKKAIHLPKE